jgi:hypothetical protein
VYGETEDSCHGGLVENLQENGLLIYSIRDMPVETELQIKVFFSRGHGFDGFKAFARVIWKSSERQSGWNGFKYRLEFIHLTSEDRLKLQALLQRHI